MNAVVQSIDLRQLPALSKRMLDHAELPARYLAARKALQECARLDELKDIQDKHSAIAHYAKQAKDKTLLFYAERIKLRAFERIGELLSELPTRKERSRVAAEQGLAATTACRAYDAVQALAKVREKLIEATPPPTMTQLAQYGRRYIPNSYESRRGFYDHARREEQIKATPLSVANDLFGYLRNIEQDLRDFLDDRCGGRFTMTQVGRSVHPEEAAEIRTRALGIIEMLDELEQALPKDDA